MRGGCVGGLPRPPFNQPDGISRPPFNQPGGISRPPFNQPGGISRPPFNQPDGISRPPFNQPGGISRPPFNQPDEISRPPFNQPDPSEIIRGGLSAYGEKILDSSSEYVQSNISKYFSDPQYYFQVNGHYVKNKLKVILFPFLHRPLD
ncbi:hypothetical protein AQUCO_03900094v1 [Aquilegia coerulea]|uniref:Uncharacterized protein n=1 Tax=Aquilegia coerulea TaxID=218851 RepID=A0A2G5CRV5_AQUCA|nr:hypothetical protein AQUCO_03900094v1 [Aquilegia coerulea]